MVFTVPLPFAFVNVQFDGAKLPVKPFEAAEAEPFNVTFVPAHIAVGGLPAPTVGAGFTTIVIVAVVAHCPAVGVKV